MVHICKVGCCGLSGAALTKPFLADKKNSEGPITKLFRFRIMVRKGTRKNRKVRNKRVMAKKEE